jgi:OOP family OmpA-OmpF porin
MKIIFVITQITLILLESKIKAFDIMNRHLLTLLVALILITPSIDAQSPNHKFGLEVNGGVREYHGDLGSALYLQKRPDYQFVGASFGMYLNPSFDANLYGSSGDLGFYKNSYDIRTTETYRQGFRSRITNVMLGVTYKFNNGYILDEDATFKPYLRGGWGVSQSITRLSHNKVGYSESRNWLASHWNVGAGLKIKLTPSLDLSLSEMFNYSFDDNYDGEPFTLTGAKLNVAEEGNKPLHDAFLAHSIGFVFNFGEGMGSYGVKDTDGDGVNDKFDICPETPEGIEVDSVGCPYDDDKDGIPNELDKCPTKPGSVEGEGCPDSDGDGLFDHQDKCPFTPGDKEREGCPANDKDRDGIADEADKCPDVPGLKEFDGCPDSDKDGIIDSEDKCPLKAGTKEGEGCPDSDGDGVYDHIDVCPVTPGVVENKGCPEIKEEVKEAIRLAAAGIYFESGKDIIKSESFTNLDKLVEILNEYPKAQVAIDGHTDSQGADADNLKLSQDRANAVKRYLASKGVDEGRLTATGYGETQPVADNGSADGRALNRRVDFKLSY